MHPRHVALLLSSALLPAQTWVVRGSPELSRVHLVTHAATFDQTSGRLLVVDSQQHTWAATFAAGGIDWLPLPGSLRQANPSNVGLCFDPARRRTIAVLFSPSGTSEWDGDGWVSVDTSLAPNRIAADLARGCLVGVLSPDLGTSTRTFERVGTAWVQRGGFQSGVLPGWVGFDPVRGQVLMHGPDTAGVSRTHAWNGATWTLVASNSGPDTLGFAMATDTGRGRLVAHGGVRAAGAVADTWEWTGTAWSLVQTAGVPPAQNRGLVEVPGLGVVALGGVQSSATGVGIDGDDLWVWNGTTWTSLPFVAPVWRRLHALAHDALRGEVVLFGGEDAAGVLGDTFVWNGARWARRTPAVAPSARRGAAMAFDSVRGVVQLFGGTNGATDFGDLWQWDGISWAPSPALGAPPARSRAALAFDAGRGRLVLFGGTTLPGLWRNDTWEWDGVAWQPAAPALLPVPLREPRLAHDAVRGRTVLHGQNPNSMSVLGATYEWDGQAFVDFGGSHFQVGKQVWWDANAGVVRGYFDSAVVFDWNGVNWQHSTFEAILYRQGAGPSLAVAADPVRGAFAFDGAMTWVATSMPATAADVGTGCGAVGRTPILAAAASPVLGAPGFGVAVQMPAVAGGLVAVGIGFGSGSVALGSGCTWHLQGSVASQVLLTNGSGHAVWSVPLPASVSLRGLTLFAQGAAFDAQAPLGFGLSQAMRYLLGD